MLYVMIDQSSYGKYYHHHYHQHHYHYHLHHRRACWHIGVANTVALQKANIFERIKNNEELIGGVIDVDNNNNPTGILKERAVELITAISSINFGLYLSILL